MVAALLSWYDENPAWLTRCVESLAWLRVVTHLVALDGAYALYPDGEGWSPKEQADAISLAAQAQGLNATIWHPATSWQGNEIEKRNALFAFAEKTPCDWWFVIDADEHVTGCPDTIASTLVHAQFDVGAVELIEPTPLGPVVFPTHPKLFRAIPGTRCVGEHCCYRTPDGRNLWGDATKQRLEPRFQTGITVRHERQLRPVDRRRAGEQYYRTRDEAAIENLPTHRASVVDL